MSRIRQTKEGVWVIDGDQITGWIEETGMLNHDRTIDRLLEYLPEGGTAIDVGANIGSHTIAYARKVGSKGTVLAFEPNPEAFQCLVRNMELFPWVICLQLALTDEQTATDWLTVNKINSGASYIGEPSGIKTLTLDFADLDNWLVLESGLDFLKIDVEGMEVELVRAGMSIIKDWKPTVFCEVNRGALKREYKTPEDLFFLFDECNYAYRNFDLNQPNNFDMEQFDILCQPK